MLPSKIKELSDPIAEIYEKLTDELMLNIAKLLATNGQMTSTAEWQMRKLAQMGQLNQQTIRIIAEATKICPDLIYYAVETAALTAALELEPAFQAAVTASILGEAVEAAASPGIVQAMTYYQKQATDTLNLVNTVMAYKSRDAYTGIVNKTVNIVNRNEYLATLGKNTASVVIGAQSRQAALRQCIKEFSEQGIPGFVDAVGREWSPEAYVNMDIRTTVNNVAHEAQLARMDDYGADLIEVSSHIGARPRCEPFQGRLFSRSGDKGFTTDLNDNRIYYGSWKETSYGEPAGLLGINCGHQIYPFFPGLSTQTYHPYDKQENDERYAQSQQQRYLERQVRNSKRECAMLDAMGDKDGFDAAALKLKQRQAALKDYTSTTGRTMRSDRTQVSGYNKSVSGKAIGSFKKQATQYYKSVVQNEPAITADVLKIASNNGVETAGLNFRLKSFNSFMRKASAEGGFTHLGDIIRYTYTADSTELSQKTLDSLEDFQSAGYDVIKVKNYWLQTVNPYRGINTNLRAAGGQVFELQFHTPESLDMKEAMHPLYEKARVITDTKSAEYLALQDKMFDMAAQLIPPLNIESVVNIP